MSEVILLEWDCAAFSLVPLWWDGWLGFGPGSHFRHCLCHSSSRRDQPGEHRDSGHPAAPSSHPAVTHRSRGGDPCVTAARTTRALGNLPVLGGALYQV